MSNNQSNTNPSKTNQPHSGNTPTTSVDKKKTEALKPVAPSTQKPSDAAKKHSA
jgi:hypothetical protein